MLRWRMAVAPTCCRIAVDETELGREFLDSLGIGALLGQERKPRGAERKRMPDRQRQVKGWASLP